MMTNHNLISSFELDSLLNPILGYHSCILGLFDFYKSNAVVVEGKIQNWEKMNDIDILNNINIWKYKFNDVIIVNDSTIINNEAFYVKKEKLSDFVTNYLSDYGECFFNSDIFFIPVGIGKIISFNHDGYKLNYNLPVELTSDGFKKYNDLIINKAREKNSER
ncbi:hypothetical protein H8R13_02820 [Morganella morganii]|uniref:hypothetical protein n=1 Tax=Morganella morganii TaxID=582 RepID=UPI00164CB9FE|nr:hypothetical protein [Morganella morganii]MBC4010682.1 hypothetical protein [Morganella morganii]